MSSSPTGTSSNRRSTTRKCFSKHFETAPETKEARASTFVVKGEQLLNLTTKDWVVRDTHPHEFPGSAQTARQALMVERYIEQQPAYPFLKRHGRRGDHLARYFVHPLLPLSSDEADVFERSGAAALEGDLFSDAVEVVEHVFLRTKTGRSCTTWRSLASPVYGSMRPPARSSLCGEAGA